MNFNKQTNIISHPLLADKLTTLRCRNTDVSLFRKTVHDISLILSIEASRDLTVEDRQIETPISAMVGKQLKHKAPVIVPILRAGLGMLAGFLTLMPHAHVGFVGFERDESTHEPRQYYNKCPSMKDVPVFVIDPMLATGGTAIETINELKRQGANTIHFCCIVAAPEGLSKLQAAHPNVAITMASLDERLNDEAYILPGLGDCGDRLYGTF